MTISIKIIKKSEKPEQKEVWDEIAGTWSEYRNKTLPFVEEFLKNKKGKVIDLGCGSGRNMISNKNLEFYEIDFSQEQIALASKKAEELRIKAFFYNQSADNLKKDFKDNMFDYGLFIAALHCIEGKKQRENALREFYRVLKKESESLISILNSEDKRFDNIKNNGDIYMPWKVNGKENIRYYYLFKKHEFLDLLKKIGFKMLEFYLADKDRFSKKNWIVKVKK